MTVRPTPGGVDRLLNLPAVKVQVTRAAQQIANDASGLAPRDTGFLQRSYKWRRAVAEPGRVVATAYTTSRIGHIIEWGSSRQPARAPLRRAAEVSGLRTRLAPKGTKA